MDAHERSILESEVQTLRADLKKWETDWAQHHNGEKPGRGDIKKNVDIEQKYKSYNKLRDKLSGKLRPSSRAHSDTNPRKRKSSDDTAASTRQTPQKRSRTAATPSRGRTNSDVATAVTPSLSRKLFSPAAPTSIGPTPQRDGRVLGLFDLLEADKDDGTPSRRPPTPPTADANDDGPVQATPQRGMDESGGGRRRWGGRTPMSSSKRHMLDTFLSLTSATPLRRRDGNAFAARVGITTPRAAPESASKLAFATPAFLKRTAAVVGKENTEVRPLRLPPKPTRKGLSSVVAGLQRLEEETLDEELEMLREMEMEESQGGVVPKQGTGTAERRNKGDETGAAALDVNPSHETAVEVIDSQDAGVALLSGFDDENAYDNSPPDGEGLDCNGQPLRVFKKKGQKRTTRRVNMKPTRTRRPVAPQPQDTMDSDAEEAIPETQVNLLAAVEDAADLLSGSEFGGSGSDDEAAVAEKAKKSSKAKNAKAKEGPVKRAVRKVKATAHANFKRLKLKNNGSKGGPGYNSRFRRRR